MAHSTALAQKIYKQIQDLPEENLIELAKYIEFLWFKTRAATKRATKKTPRLDSKQINKLDGLLKGYDFSPEFIAEARREMWKRFGVEQPFRGSQKVNSYKCSVE
jgi:hypothetical protein